MVVQYKRNPPIAYGPLGRALLPCAAATCDSNPSSNRRECFIVCLRSLTTCGASLVAADDQAWALQCRPLQPKAARLAVPFCLDNSSNTACNNAVVPQVYNCLVSLCQSHCPGLPRLAPSPQSSNAQSRRKLCCVVVHRREVVIGNDGCLQAPPGARGAGD